MISSSSVPLKQEKRWTLDVLGIELG